MWLTPRSDKLLQLMPEFPDDEKDGIVPLLSRSNFEINPLFQHREEPPDELLHPTYRFQFSAQGYPRLNVSQTRYQFDLPSSTLSANKTGTWRSMYLTSPPCTALKPITYQGNGYDPSHGWIRDEEGVRLGLLVDSFRYILTGSEGEMWGLCSLFRMDRVVLESRENFRRHE